MFIVLHSEAHLHFFSITIFSIYLTHYAALIYFGQLWKKFIRAMHESRKKQISHKIAQVVTICFRINFTFKKYFKTIHFVNVTDNFIYCELGQLSNNSYQQKLSCFWCNANWFCKNNLTLIQLVNQVCTVSTLKNIYTKISWNSCLRFIGLKRFNLKHYYKENFKKSPK